MVTLEALRRRHSEHKSKSNHWQLLEAMVAGGNKMDAAAKRKLLPNPDGRPEEVMTERVNLATYTNKIGPILTRFNSQLFSQPSTFDGSKHPFWEKQFLLTGALLDTDDDSRASFRTFLSESMFGALTCGKMIAQVDTRVASQQAASLPDQEKNGELEPYVVLHPRSALWDWESDTKGFLFTKLHQFRMRRGRWDEAPIPEHDFTIYQRSESGEILASRYFIRKKLKDGEKPPTGPLNLDALKEEDVEITPAEGPGGQPFEDQVIFSYKGIFEFPVLTLTLPEPLCIADQLFEPQKSYFCQTAALEYALYSNNYAMPIITGVEDDDDDPLLNQKMGEGYYLTLKKGQDITTFERSGSTITTAISYRGEVKRDIYDQLQQIAMSASDGAAIVARSADSKREDRRPEQILLEQFGQLAREYAVQILRVAGIAHAEDVQWKVDGFDNFLGEGVLEEIGEMTGMQMVPVPSETFKRETTKHFARRVGKSFVIPADKLTQVLEEIDQAALEDFQPPQPPQPAAA